MIPDIGKCMCDECPYIKGWWNFAGKKNVLIWKKFRLRGEKTFWSWAVTGNKRGYYWEEWAKSGLY